MPISTHLTGLKRPEGPNLSVMGNAYRIQKNNDDNHAPDNICFRHCRTWGFVDIPDFLGLHPMLMYYALSGLCVNSVSQMLAVHRQGVLASTSSVI